MPEVRKERTDWRDSHLDSIHNNFGYGCPANGVEFLMLEYDMGTPVALVDYRLKGRINDGFSDSLKMLCDKRNPSIPYIISEYEICNKQLCNINIVCCNESAKKLIGDKNNISERDYIELMYSLRERIVKGRTEQGKILARDLSPYITNTKENWNGEILSHRHRDWGWDCPVVDVDFIVINNGKPCAIIEYKNKKSFATPSKFKFHPTGKALSNLADTMLPKIPLLFVYYNDDFTDFNIYPITRGWDKYEDYFGIHLSRDEYFKFLRSL